MHTAIWPRACAPDHCRPPRNPPVVTCAAALGPPPGRISLPERTRPTFAPHRSLRHFSTPHSPSARYAVTPARRYAAYWPLRRLLTVTPPTGRYAAYWPLRRLLAVAPPTGRYAAYWPLHRLLAVTPPTGRYIAYWPLQRPMAVTPHDRYASH